MRKSRGRSLKDKKVLQALDRCVVEARKAERSGNWQSAYQALDRLNTVAQGGQLFANLVSGVVSGLQHNWIGVVLAIITMCSIGIALYIHFQGYR